MQKKPAKKSLPPVCPRSALGTNLNIEFLEVPELPPGGALDPPPQGAGGGDLEDHFFGRSGLGSKNIHAKEKAKMVKKAKTSLPAGTSPLGPPPSSRGRSSAPPPYPPPPWGIPPCPGRLRWQFRQRLRRWRRPDLACGLRHHDVRVALGQLAPGVSGGSHPATLLPKIRNRTP